MDIFNEILPHLISFIAIFIIIGALVFAYVKKFMITYIIIISNLIIFILSLIFRYEIIGDLGFRPVYLSLQYLPYIYTLFTSMFVHGGLLHIFGNMLVFFFMGMAFEQRIGAKKFLIIYLITGVCGALTHSMLNLSYPNNQIILIGASGAIFGIMGAFAYSYPRDEVVMPIPLGIMFITRIKVIYAVIIFAVIETLIVTFEVEDNTAHFAHLGGLISGFILAAILLRGYKTHSKEGKTQFYDSFKPQKLHRIDFLKLEKLATKPELIEILNKIKNENVPQVRDIWLEHFFEKVNCPECSNKINHFDRKIWCEKCGYKDSY